MGDTESYFALLAFSLAVGAALGVFSDALLLPLNAAFPKRSSPEKAPRRLTGACVSAEEALFPRDRVIRARDIALFFADIIFFAVSGAVIVVLVLHLNYGEIRAITLIAALLGFVLYKRTLSRPICFALRWTAGLFTKLLKTLLKPIIAPVDRMLTALTAKVRKRRAIEKALSAIIAMEQSEIKRQEKRNGKGYSK